MRRLLTIGYARPKPAAEPMAKVPPQRFDPGLAVRGALPAAPAAALPLPLGTTVGDWVIDAVLHAGEEGFVYRGRHRDGRVSALKEFFPRALALRKDDGSMRARQAGDAITLSVAREAFRDEALALASIEPTGLVHVTGTLVAHHTLFRVMPLLEGLRLDSVVAARGAAPTVRELRALVEGLLAPLEALHAAGLLHGHVCPSQILIATPPAQPLVTLLGFGNVAREIGAFDDAPWSAPEAQLGTQASRVTSAADLYSVAACAWFAAAGRPPPSARERAEGLIWSIREGLEDIDDAPGDPVDLRASLLQAIEAALAMAPEARPQRVADMRRLLAGDPAVRLVSVQPPPLWVGEMPDRDEQRGDIEVFAPTVDLAPRPARTAPATAPAWSDARVAAPPVNTDQAERDDTGRERPFNAAPAAKRRLTMPALVLVIVGVAGGLWWWSAQRGAAMPERAIAEAAPIEASVIAPEAAPAAAAAVTPAASAPQKTALSPPTSAAAPAPLAAAPKLVPSPPPKPAPKPAPPPATAVPKRTTSPVAPRTACAGRTQFAALYCLQEQCNRAALRRHPQCEALRRAGDIN